MEKVTTLFSLTWKNLFMRLKFQRPPAREDQDTQITEYETKAVEILNFPRKQSKKEAIKKLNYKLKSFLLNVTIFLGIGEMLVGRSCL